MLWQVETWNLVGIMSTWEWLLNRKSVDIFYGEEKFNVLVLFYKIDWLFKNKHSSDEICNETHPMPQSNKSAFSSDVNYPTSLSINVKNRCHE